jgi:hypothetical protein
VKCKKNYEIRVLLSEKGYYVGTLDSAYDFNCRISNDFFTLKSDAVKELSQLENIDKFCSKCYKEM